MAPTSTALDPVLPMPGANRVGQGTAVEQSRAVAEVQAAVVVAQACPRDLAFARTQMQDSCAIQAFAERAFFRYSRAGQAITGPSVHLARELARCFGNIQYGLTELRRDDDHGQSEMQAWAWDVQNNTRASSTFIVPHKRDRSGQDPVLLRDMRDIYENNANHGARRQREAIFDILPTWFTEEAMAICSSTISKGDGSPLEDRIPAAVKLFADIGVDVGLLEQKLGRAQERWTAFDLVQLKQAHRSIQRGEVTIEEEFPQRRVAVTAADLLGPQAAPPNPVTRTAPATEPADTAADLGAAIADAKGALVPPRPTLNADVVDVTPAGDLRALAQAKGVKDNTLLIQAKKDGFTGTSFDELLDDPDVVAKVTAWLNGRSN